MGRRNQALHQTQNTIHRQRENRGWKRTRQNHARVGERESGDDRLSETSRANERSERRRTDSNDRGGPDSCHDHRCGERKSHPHEPLHRRRAESFRRCDRVRISIAYSCVGPAGDWIQSVQPQRHQRRDNTDSKQRDHERKQCDAGNRLKHAQRSDAWLGKWSGPLEEEPKWNSDDYRGEKSEAN